MVMAGTIPYLVKSVCSVAGQWLLISPVILLAGCLPQLKPEANQSLTEAASDHCLYQEQKHWSGRLLVRSTDRKFQTSFDLDGNAKCGSLRLFNPLASTLIFLQWDAHGAVLQNNLQKRYFRTTRALLQKGLGTDLPLEALFDWLNGTPYPAPGWTVNFNRITEGTIKASRHKPKPVISIQIVLDP